MTRPEQPIVILLHGLGLWPGHMAPLARRLRRRGWPVRTIGYDSRHQTLAGSARQVRRQLDPARPIHLVGHSLGGLIAAALLRDPQGLHVGRVVQIGAPNLGSVQANRAHFLAPVRHFYGPVLAELCRHRDAPARHERIGAIAGVIQPNLAGGPGDGTVSLASALAAAGHHVTVRVMHSFLPLSPQVAVHTDAFLTHGRFVGGGAT